ncbi:MAG: BON domain-containing protein [Rhodospirillales bacterium]|nr:BON domain-containing protein [Rhodospirillales bacterium]
MTERCAARRFIDSRRALALIGLLAAAPLAGCVGAAVGAGATAGVAAVQERGIKGAVSDTAIRAEINHYWLQKDQALLGDMNLQIHEGRVLVTGSTKDADLRAEAITLAWKAKGVREVINEVEISSEGGIVNYARDTAISAELRTRLLFAKEVQSVNYSIETVNGVVYLIGVAQHQEELDRVLNIARNIANVRRVVSHVLMKDDPRRFTPPVTS